MLTIPVPLADRSYDVLVGTFDVLDAAARIAAAAARSSGLAVLVDGDLVRLSPRVAALVDAVRTALPGLPIRQLALAGGEACKSFSELEKTCEWLAAQGFDRGALILGIGGGATTDHAGFAAAIYLRGIDFILCPTTLLAMVDASVGGKTAVDLRAGKNLVGAFHQPRLVLADLEFLTTLPVREQAAGMAEIVKAGLIADAALFSRLEDDAAAIGSLDRGRIADFVAAAVRVKVDVVSEDEREAGRRAILNFGHTVGHALEAESGYALLHGEAVALGMMAALALGTRRGVTESGLTSRVGALLSRLQLPVDLEGRISASVLDRLEVDKKRRADAVRFVFVRHPGETVIEALALGELKSALTPSS